MSAFDFDLAGQKAADETAALNPLDASQADPGFWSGTGTGVGQGVMRGGARVGQFLGMAAAAPVALYESATGQEGRFTDDYFRQVDEIANNAVDYWTPAANEVGTAGRVLGGLSEIVLPLAASAGNPALLLGSQGLGTATDLSRQGVGAPAAVAVGTIQAAATAVGFRLPFLGKTLGQRMASGVGGNLIVNTAATAAQRGVLELAGEDAAAQQFDPFDLEARAVDVLTGMAFGGLAHLGAPRGLSASEQAAAIAAANARHFQHDTAPGTPADIAASLAHQFAMEQATDALMRGERVVAPPDVVAADFTPRLRTPVEVPPEFRVEPPSEETAPPVVPPEAAVPPEPIPGETPAAATDSTAPADTVTDPTVAAAQQIADVADLHIATGEIDAEGVPVTRSAREVMAAAAEEVRMAKEQTRGIEAAVTCFLQRGTG